MDRADVPVGPGRPNLTATALPGLILPVVKLPPLVAVCLTSSRLAQTTLSPGLISIVLGLYLKSLIVTVTDLLAVALGAAEARGSPARSRTAATPEIARNAAIRTLPRCSEIECIALIYGA